MADSAGRQSGAAPGHGVGSEPILALDEVWKTYHLGAVAVHALRGVSLQARAGELVAIMGPSGSGKSTLMHIMGCLDTPSAGAYRLDGAEVGHLGEEELSAIRNRQIGFVFQSFNLLPSMSACSNVALPLAYAGVSAAPRRERAMAALAAVGLSDRAHHRPRELSGGQQQRVALARALATDPAIVLADEPTGNLDSEAAAEVLNLLTSLHHSGRTVLVITHEREIAERAERIVRILDGRVVDDRPT
ncbi:MAG: ABC transporter ATP-binding protein [Candidatus Dormibacteria bacterium]